MADNSWQSISGDSTMTFTPETARAICRQCNAARDRIADLYAESMRLTDVGDAGSFSSAFALQKTLSQLGTVAQDGLSKLQAQFSEIADAIRKAGLRVTDQDSDNAKALASTTDCARGYGDLIKQESDTTPYSYPDHQTGDPKPAGDDVSEAFPNQWEYELLAADMIAKGYQAMQGSDWMALAELAKRWTTLARNLNNVVAKFNKETQKLLSDGSWTGTAADKIKPGLTQFSDSISKMSEQTFQNGKEVWKWQGLVCDSRIEFDVLHKQLEKIREQQGYAAAAGPLSPATIAAQQTAIQQLQQQARDFMNVKWNPTTMQISQFGLRSIPDPQSPVGAPLPVPGTTPAGASKTINPLSKPAAGPGGAGPSAGPGGGTGPSQGNGNSKVITPAPKPGPTQGGKGTAAPPLNAATPGGPTQPLPGKGSSGATPSSGLPGSGASAARGAATRSAAANGLNAAEKAAAARAAASKLGGGAGGGAGGGMGGAAAAEKALAARAGSMGSAERMAAAEQAALQQARAGAPGTPGAAGGAPMGGRGSGGSGDEKAHKAARYLQSKENGEAIIGDQGEAAPPVVGGLNLDTSGERVPTETRIRP